MNSIILSEYNINSNRYAILCNENESIWMYLTEKENQKIFADCWICNVIYAPETIDVSQYMYSPPPAIKKYVRSKDPTIFSDDDIIKFIWSSDGENVALEVNGLIIGYIADYKGHNLNLTFDCSWGCTFDTKECYTLFRNC